MATIEMQPVATPAPEAVPADQADTLVMAPVLQVDPTIPNTADAAPDTLAPGEVVPGSIADVYAEQRAVHEAAGQALYDKYDRPKWDKIQEERAQEREARANGTYVEPVPTTRLGKLKNSLGKTKESLADRRRSLAGKLGNISLSRTAEGLRDWEMANGKPFQYGAPEEDGSVKLGVKYDTPDLELKWSDGHPRRRPTIVMYTEDNGLISVQGNDILSWKQDETGELKPHTKITLDPGEVLPTTRISKEWLADELHLGPITAVETKLPKLNKQEAEAAGYGAGDGRELVDPFTAVRELARGFDAATAAAQSAASPEDEA